MVKKTKKSKKRARVVSNIQQMRKKEVMKRPKDLGDLRKCIIFKDDGVKVFCVECDAWHNIAVLARCNVKFSWHHEPYILDCDQEMYVCAVCNADIGYLLEELDEAVLQSYW